MTYNNYIPWVEKYRPSRFENIVLSDINKTIFKNILDTDYFPNMLLYGPPGTGKTTTIINLINTYQQAHNQLNKGLMIHLNASDERGIDIIRNNINTFVNSKNLFNDGMKFIILDEVDYMTKNAQHALKYLLQINNRNVRFCLICNYISRIDESLQNELMRLRFNQLPENDILNFLEVINTSEKLNYTREEFIAIQKIYKSDIRSMINYIQSNQNIDSSKKILNSDVFDDISNHFYNDAANNAANNAANLDFINIMYRVSNIYNIEIKNLIKEYLNYIIYIKRHVSPKFLNDIELIMHQSDLNVKYMLHFLYYSLYELLHKT